MTTGYVYDPLYLEHDLRGHPENRDRLMRIMALLEEKGVIAQLTPIAPTPISMERLERVHEPGYIKWVQEVAERGGGYLDPDTYVAPRSYEAALLAAGGLVNAVRAVLRGEVDNAFALVRPPGHHARRAQGMGFCLFNNVAVAACYALEEGGVNKVLIVDFDVHHGNATQETFYAESRVLYFSTHQYPYYPGTGHWKERGVGKGEGYTVNVPLPPGVGDKGYRRIYEEVLDPVARHYCPQLILVSAGYDAHWADPLAGMRLSITGYGWLAHFLKSLADELCKGRLVFTLEGGYHLEVLSYSVLATIEALMGEEEVLDPLGPSPYPERPVDEVLRVVKAAHHLE